MSLTTANSVITLSVSGIFSAPQTLQGFSADDIFGTDAIQPNEVLQGIDGILSGGFVNVPTKQKYHFMADSLSSSLFDTWYQQMVAQQDSFTANATISLPGLGLRWTMTKGFLTSYMPLPDAKKLAQARTFEITWESSQPSAI